MMMTRTIRYRSTFAVAAACCAFALPVVQASGPAVIVEADSVETLITSTVTLTQAMGQPGLNAAMLTAMIGGTLKVPGLTGLDTTQPLQIYLFLPDVPAAPDTFTPDQLAPLMSFVLPLRGNGEAYTGALKAAYPTVEAVGSIQHFSRAEIPNMTPAEELYVALIAGRAVVSPQLEAVKLTQVSLGGQPPKAIAFPGDLRIHLDIEACIPFVDAAVAGLLASMREQPMPADMPMDPTKILEAEADALLTFMHELRSYTLGIKASSSMITLLDKVNPMPGSKTASWIAALESPSAAYLSAIPENALFASVGSGMNVMDQLAEPYGEVMEKIYGAMGPPMDQMGPVMRKMMLDIKGLYAGDLAMGVVPTADGKGVGFVEYIELADPTKAKLMIDGMLTTFNEDFGASMPGLSLVVGPARMHKQTKIQTFSYKVDPSAAQPGQPFNPASLKWMEGMQGELAYVENHLVYTLGGPEIMHGALERLGSGGKSVVESVAFSRLFSQTKGKVVEIHTLSLSTLITQLMGMLPGVPAAMQESTPSETAGMAGYSMVFEGNLIGVDRISLSEIKALQSAIPTIGATVPMLMMQMGTPTQAAPGVPGATP
jgi:hypothetical protein